MEDVTELNSIFSKQSQCTGSRAKPCLINECRDRERQRNDKAAEEATLKQSTHDRNCIIEVKEKYGTNWQKFINQQTQYCTFYYMIVTVFQLQNTCNIILFNIF